MADILTMQDLANGHLDVKALGEAANGDENKTVVTRTGETYPSAKKAIKTIFENGGLPATPFATKTLMEASALVNDKYAMVTDGGADNGLYVKTAGTWVKSAYDPLTVANAYTDKKIGAYGLQAATEVTMVEEAKGQYNIDGTFKADVGMSTSTSIAVKAGDCFVLTDIQSSLVTTNTFALFDTSGKFVAVIGAYRVQDTFYLKPQETANLKVGIYSDKKNLYTSGVIIPNDGFIKVSVKTNGTNNPTNNLNLKTTLYKTDFESFLKLTAIQAPIEVLSKFKDVFKSAKIDKALVNNGSLRFPYTTIVGEPATFGSGAFYISEKIAVKKGQFIHAHTIGSGDSPLIYFEDEAGNYLGTQSIINEYTVGMGQVRSAVPLNIKSEFTGFFRVKMHYLHSVSFLVGVSDAAINYPKNYLTKNTKSLVFNPSLGSNTRDNVNTAFNVTVLRNMASSSDNAASQVTSSIPYVLRKGEVLEYSVSAASSPLLAMIVSSDKIISTRMSEFTNEIALQATEVISAEQKAKWQIAADKTPAYYEDARKGTIAYCNEEEDTLVVFFRPLKSSPIFNTYKQSEGYEVSIHTKEEYKVKRNKELSDRFAKISAITPVNNYPTYLVFDDTFRKGMAAFPAVLLFKGEVLNYQTSGIARSTVIDLETATKPKGQIVGDIAATLTNGYGNYVEIKNLPIKAANPLSTYINQVYAHKTTIVHLSVQMYAADGFTTLDVENIIKGVKFKPVIIDLKDAVIGKNLTPYKGMGVSAYFQDADIAFEGKKGVTISQNGASDVMASFVPKDTAVEYSNWTRVSNRTLNVGAIKPLDDQNLPLRNMRPVMNYPEKDGTYLIHETEAMNTRAGYMVPEDSFVTVMSETRNRNTVLMLTDGSQEALNVTTDVFPFTTRTSDTYKLSLKTISREEVKDYQVTDKTFVEIPDLTDLTINFCTLVSNSLTNKFHTLTQIKRAGKVIKTFHCRTANQGQSSSGAFRKNVDLVFYNSKMKKVKVKFGNTLALSDYVVKSYLNSDRGHFRDTVSGDLWYQIRNAEPYPRGGVLPREVFEDKRYPTNKLARASTFAFPLEQHRGGDFYSIGTIKYKKRNENYGMQQDNPNHILMQLDWQALGFALDWKDIGMGNFEIRSPEIDGYTSGDTTLPVEYANVRASVVRITDWMRGVYLGTIDARATYKDYVKLDGLLDFCVAVLVHADPEATRNNFFMGTYDSTHWDFFPYDHDKSWGGGSGTKLDFAFFDPNQFFGKINSVFEPELKARYKRLRNLGVVDARHIQDLMLTQDSFISEKAWELDVKYWGEIKDDALLGYSMDWAYKRINYLDGVYGYVEKDLGIVLQADTPAITLAAGASRVTNYPNTLAKVGDIFKVEMGYTDLKGGTVAVTCTVDGTITVTHSNPTASSLVFSKNYLRVYKL